MNPIGWTDQTWNPVTGCTPVSLACDHCYARRMAKRLRGRAGYPDMVSAWSPERGGCMVQRDASFDVTLHPDRLGGPLHWRKSRRVFVVSMGDLFHEDVPEEFIIEVLDTMNLARQHTFQVLTKRPVRMRDVLKRYYDGPPEDRLDVMANVWIGVTAEDHQQGDERIPSLLDTPAAVRFVSCEPLLGPVDLSPWFRQPKNPPFWTARELGQPAIDWVIAGAESGPGARPADPAWFRSLREQCKAAEVPFYLKDRPGDIDGQEYREFPK